jgi:hypothetical protein
MFRKLNSQIPVFSLSLLLLCLLIAGGGTAHSYYVVASPSATPTPTPTPTPAQNDQLKEYREVIEKEGKYLQEQSKEYYARVEKFAYIALTALVVALVAMITFFTWLFGQTRKEVVNEIKANLQASVLSSASEELERIKKEKLDAIESQYQMLKEKLEAINSFGKQRVVWLLTESMKKPEGEIAALSAVGLQRIETSAPKTDDAKEIKESLNGADLVIVTFDGSPEAKSLLRNAAAAVKFRQPPISLLIYTYGFYTPENRPVQLGADDLRHLNDLSSFAPANFPATLVSQAQSLIVKTRYLT